VTVLRFWNSDVTQNLSGVLEVIALKVAELKQQAPASSQRWRAGNDPLPTMSRDHRSASAPAATPTPTLPLSGGGSRPRASHR